MSLFDTQGDYLAFERILEEAHEQVPMRTVAYCVMPNHWHFVLWPRNDGDITRFMQWLTLTHTQRWHAAHGTTGMGHIYKGRFKDFLIEQDRHYLTVCRYVERNALRAGLVKRAEDWRWCSLWRRVHGDASARALLSDGPRRWPNGWVATVNEPLPDREERALRLSIDRERPFGSPTWVEECSRRLGLTSTLRPRGRPPLHS